MYAKIETRPMARQYTSCRWCCVTNSCTGLIHARVETEVRQPPKLSSQDPYKLVDTYAVNNKTNGLTEATARTIQFMVVSKVTYLCCIIY